MTTAEIRNDTIEIDAYVPHPANYNRHPDEQIARLSLSLERFGQPESVTVWDHPHTDADGNPRQGYFIAGHGVREAAHQLRWSHLRADILPADYPEELALAYIPAANRLAQLSDPDDIALARLLDAAKAHDADLLEAIGYSEEEFQAVMSAAEDGLGGSGGGGEAGTDTPPETSRAEELRQEWGTELGQMWQLGPHRVICGDCTDSAVVERLMGGERADLVFTDPPYNVASHSRNYASDVSASMADLSQSEWDKDFDIESIFPLLEKVMADDVTVYVCTSHWLVQTIWEWMWEWSDFCSYNVWCKPNPMPSLSKRHWTWGTELIAYATRGKHVFNFPNEGHSLNWWNIPKRKDTDHPTEKVIGVPELAINRSSREGDVVFDGFLGSGTTLIAAHNLNRICYGCEISPAYTAVILERFAQHTNIKPELLTT